MKIIDTQQGSSAWRALRLQHRCASEAAAVFGASKHLKRSELLRMKALGLQQEFSDYVQTHILDKGHEFEAGSRALVEDDLGDELFPVTGTTDDGYLWASLDGLTMDGGTVFESKRWNEELAAQVRAGELEPHYYWQLEQELAVTGAKRVIFACSDGKPERHITMEYRPVPGRREQLLAAWVQFDADLAAYVPAEPVAPTVAPQVELLPAVQVRMDGALTVHSNLDALEPLLRAFIARIPAAPTTDDDFAYTDAACKTLKKIEDELDRSEAAALASLSSVEQMQRLKATLHKLARDTRLQREKLVKARKDQLRTEQIHRGRAALAAYLQGMNQSLGGGYMPDIQADFAGVISGMKTMVSIRDAVDTELARSKIAAGEAFQRIQANLNHLREHASEYKALFPDTRAIVLKAPEDLQALVTARISEHRAAEEKRLEAERTRIRAEEEARARAQAQREQQEREAEERRNRAAAEEAHRQEAEALQRRQREEAAARAEQERQQQPAATPVSAPALSTVEAFSDRPAATVHPMPTRAPAAPAGPPTLRLGQINERLGFTVSADFLARIGYPMAAQDKAAKLWRESDWHGICAAIAQHVVSVANGQKAVA